MKRSLGALGCCHVMPVAGGPTAINESSWGGSTSMGSTLLPWWINRHWPHAMLWWINVHGLHVILWWADAPGPHTMPQQIDTPGSYAVPLCAHSCTLHAIGCTSEGNCSWGTRGDVPPPPPIPLLPPWRCLPPPWLRAVPCQDGQSPTSLLWLLFLPSMLGIWGPGSSVKCGPAAGAPVFVGPKSKAVRWLVRAGGHCDWWRLWPWLMRVAKHGRFGRSRPVAWKMIFWEVFFFWTETDRSWFCLSYPWNTKYRTTWHRGNMLTAQPCQKSQISRLTSV